MLARLSCSAVIISALLASFDAESIGDTCTTEDGKTGTCITLRDCEEALNKIKSQKYPKIYYYNKLVPIVCCSKQQVTKTTVGEIVAQKCVEYLQPPPVPKVKPLVCRGGCGGGGFNGVRATPREFVHMAALGYGEKENMSWVCGGSLISEKFVLTAAHCLLSAEFGSPKWVRLGDLNLANSADDKYAKTYNIKRIIRHPQHNSRTRRNDIALLELSEIVTMNEYVKPACLPSSNDFTGTLTATGWGVTELGTPSDYLVKVYLEPFNYSRCHQIFRREVIDNETQLCIGSTATLTQDTCPGDSGGPLQVHHPEFKKYHIVVGITSFGKACGYRNIPAIYTKVFAFIPWIESIVWSK